MSAHHEPKDFDAAFPPRAAAIHVISRFRLALVMACALWLLIGLAIGMVLP